ncbi:MAG: helix-turn-helix domain-containing protein [Gammaproteobacteria bacterium]|nr:helix-turn-helix domain-containing protein [Gammaproteobacteria bacterium]
MNAEHNVVALERATVTCPDCRLRDLCIPRGLPAAEVGEFASMVRHGRLMPRGHYLYRQGDPLSSVFLIKTGSVKSYFAAEDGAEQIVGFHLAGDLIGLDAVERGVHGCSIVTLEHTSVCELPYPRMEQLCQRVPDLLHEILLKVGTEMSRGHQLRLLISQRGAEERLAIFLLDLSARLGERGYSPTDLMLPMSRYDIANYLGVAAETVSRTFTRFEQQGLLAVDRRQVRIRDAAGLRTLTAHPQAAMARSGTR